MSDTRCVAFVCITRTSGRNKSGQSPQAFVDPRALPIVELDPWPWLKIRRSMLCKLCSKALSAHRKACVQQERVLCANRTRYCAHQTGCWSWHEAGASSRWEPPRRRGGWSRRSVATLGTGPRGTPASRGIPPLSQISCLGSVWTFAADPHVLHPWCGMYTGLKGAGRWKETGK